MSWGLRGQRSQSGAACDGSVIAWGRNTDGQTNVPPTAVNVIAIAAGWAHSAACARMAQWWPGEHDYGQTNVPFYLTNAVALAAGYYHTLPFVPMAALWPGDYKTRLRFPYRTLWPLPPDGGTALLCGRTER